MEYDGKDYEELLGLKPPWKVEKVVVDQDIKRVDVYVIHLKGLLNCPGCNMECQVYDHLRERTWRERDSIDFATYIHTSPPRINCKEHGIVQVDIPWAERLSRFTMRFEAYAIDILMGTDVTHASRSLGITWTRP